MAKLINRYIRLPNSFYEHCQPAKFPKPTLIRFNEGLSQEIGLSLDASDQEKLGLIFSGQLLLPGSVPVSLAYAGHQFGHFVPQLGDGRAHLLGECENSKEELYDIQLKGSGPSRFSRGGDGKSALGPVLREYIVSEAMHALGVPTTRALAAVLTGEPVFREVELPGAILTRVASSHLRIGSFEYFAARGETDHLQSLAEFAIEKHTPHLLNSDDKYLHFFNCVADRQVDLICRWMSLGFIHGVMNTDNTSISGQTIDYGPCAFMDRFQNDKVFSSIDRSGRYAYDQQPSILLWNLNSLANCLVPLSSVKALSQAMEKVVNSLQEKQLETLAKKFGLFSSQSEDASLFAQWFQKMEDEQMDFTNAFRSLSKSLDKKGPWFDQWRARLEKQEESTEEACRLMDSVNPFLIPRNHQVQKAIALGEMGDFSHFYYLLKAYKKPYIYDPKYQELTTPPLPHEEVSKTFCGT